MKISRKEDRYYVDVAKEDTALRNGSLAPLRNGHTESDIETGPQIRAGNGSSGSAPAESPGTAPKRYLG